ncbi:hypothetical protein JKP88DRAFT_194667 [Tribonema minus]|uniref:NADH dehydrogenase [ubiquinone] 1 alpha subcomplex subunit 8 n=1 Tax=Tribonema minus TaxID=303371 RepID=A0A836CH14_9STRA|nr:hypothetical protein JKP88DRAFT_194667 [Tribonema minus]|eukprot:TRINITY_DN1306_c0_g1_i1.p1 TRINITY_DN1306_c0_g1~~TRINITY_DN1306_c0_g1_i1.p1  ORF type:complete len:110 (+),score=22.37 TRINITY_DN1306_c0_g1_i1:150-479(+)
MSAGPTGDVLWAASKLIGKECARENVAFFECKDVDLNPEKCLAQGYYVTACVNATLNKVETHCSESFNEWKDCLKHTYKNHFLPCRELQRKFEACWDGIDAQKAQPASS